MHKKFLEYWNFLFTLNYEQDLNLIQKEVIYTLTLIENLDLKELLIFVTDEYLIYKFDFKWIDLLLEKFFFNTCIGGVLFYKKLKNHMEKNNMEMIKLYVLSIKSGFIGGGFYEIKNIMEKTYILFENKEKIHEKIIYRPKVYMEKSWTLGFFLLLIFFYFIFNSINDYILLQYFKKSLNMISKALGDNYVF
jgi:hypothetical protein